MVVGLFLSNCISIFIYYKTVKEIIDKGKLAKTLEETSTKNEYLNKLLQQHNVFLHSIRKQSQDMLAFLDKKEYEGLSEYIKNVYSDTTNVYNMINSDCEIVDMIINDRLYIIKNNDIAVRVKIEDTDFFPLDYVHMFDSLVSLIEQHHLEYMAEHVPERNQTNITVLFVEG